MSAVSEVSDLPTTTEPVPFYESRWKTSTLITGLVFIALWRSSAVVDRRLAEYVPWLVWLIAFGLLPQLFLLLFPIVTRIPRGRFYIPSLRRCLFEFGIAIPIVIATAVVAVLVDYVLDRISPGTTLEPEEMTRLSESPQRTLVALMLLFTFTFVPVAEELFFRGFLQNSLRARLPWTLAIVIQSLIFGFCHFFGVVHSVAASAMGLILALVYEWRRTLITPMLIHALSNGLSAVGVVVMAYAYANSPILGVGGDPGDTTCMVRHILPDSAAEKAGLQLGDEIVSINGQPAQDIRHLAKIVRRYKVGDTVPVSLNRSGTSITVNVVLQRRDP